MTWKPAVYKGSTLYEFPRTVNVVNIKDSWDMREAKVPLADRNHVNGVSRNGVSITVGGLIAFDGETGSPFCAEADRWAAYEALRSALDVSDDSERFEFFVYHNPATPYYRKFKNCVCKECSLDVGDDSRTDWPYTVQIFAETPTIYTTAPGA